MNVCELFTGSTTIKLINALNEAQMKAILSYQGLSKFQLAMFPSSQYFKSIATDYD